MKRWIGWCVLVTFLSQHCAAVSIQQLIKDRTELRQLREYMRDKKLQLFEDLAEDQGPLSYSFFAPSNDAFLNIPAEVTGNFDFIRNLNNIFHYHTTIAQEPVLTTNQGFEDKSYNTLTEDLTYLYLRTVNGEYYVNGAKVIETDIIADNGVLHIIDTFMYQPGLSVAALKYISDQSQSSKTPRTFKFKRLLDEYSQKGKTAIYFLNQNLADTYVTVFIPSDDAFRNVDESTLRALENDEQELSRVIERHIMHGDVDQVYHTSLLAQYGDLPGQNMDSLVAMDGHIEVRHFKDEMYVSNNDCGGRIVKANITLANGVAHIIDKVIGWQHSDIFGQIERDDEVSEFETYMKKASPQLQTSMQVQAGSTLQVDDRKKITIFVPENQAFFNIERKLQSFDITQNRTQLDSIISMHMIPGVLHWNEMVEGVSRDTRYSGLKAKFYTIDEETYVEVDHVKARVIRGDICAKNGLIHYVDRVLGVPFLTILNEIENRDHLLSLYGVLDGTAIDVTLDDRYRKMTFFAAVNSAFEHMREGEIGRQLLDPRSNTPRLQNVLKRHIVNGEFYLSSLDESGEDSMTVNSEFGSWDLRKEGRGYVIEYGSAKINIIEADIKLANGVLHIIDAVIYDESPEELRATAGRGATLQPLFALTFVLSIVSQLIWCLV